MPSPFFTKALNLNQRITKAFQVSYIYDWDPVNNSFAFYKIKKLRGYIFLTACLTWGGIIWPSSFLCLLFVLDSSTISLTRVSIPFIFVQIGYLAFIYDLSFLCSGKNMEKCVNWLISNERRFGIKCEKWIKRKWTIHDCPYFSFFMIFSYLRCLV